MYVAVGIFLLILNLGCVAINFATGNYGVAIFNGFCAGAVFSMLLKEILS